MQSFQLSKTRRQRQPDPHTGLTSSGRWGTTGCWALLLMMQWLLQQSLPEPASFHQTQGYNVAALGFLQDRPHGWFLGSEKVSKIHLQSKVPSTHSLCKWKASSTQPGLLSHLSPSSISFYPCLFYPEVAAVVLYEVTLKEIQVMPQE